MTNYFKVYVKPRDGGWKRTNVKTSKEVKAILREAQCRGYERYMIIKRLKRKTDVPIAQGSFPNECKVVEVDGLDVDWRVVGANVVIYDKYIEAKRLEMEGEER